MKRWFLAGGTVAVVLMLATFNPDMPLVDGNSDITIDTNKPTDHKDVHSHDHHDEHHQNSNASITSPTGNPHFDQLTPEMKQALKDSLLLENDTETFTKDDGTVVLPANRRSTQVSVAVQMPDGTIQIREYSNIPKPKIEFTKDIKKK